MLFKRISYNKKIAYIEKKEAEDKARLEAEAKALVEQEKSLENNI